LRGPRGGFQAVSNQFGQDLWLEISTHDDGIYGQGGTNTLCVGAQGTGKTTIAEYLAPQIKYLSDVRKEQFFSTSQGTVKPETILWMGSEQDYWNLFMRENYLKAFPGGFPRAVKVFVHEDDNFIFYEQGMKGVEEVTSKLDLHYYKSHADLMSSLAVGGINVVYLPKEHFLSPDLKLLLNQRMLATEEEKKFFRDEKDYKVSPVVFFYELLQYIYSTRGKAKARQWYSAVIDECHRYFPAAVPKPMYYLVDWLGDMMADTRRSNFSIYGFTHGLNVVDWRVKPRFGYFIWMEGSYPDQEFSMISSDLIIQMAKINRQSRSFGIRWTVIERKKAQFGKMQFANIPHRAPLLIARREGILTHEPDPDPEPEPLGEVVAG